MNICCVLRAAGVSRYKKPHLHALAMLQYTAINKRKIPLTMLGILSITKAMGQVSSWVFPGQLNHSRVERLGAPRKQMGQPLKTGL